jgi:hypothetical protein
VSIGDRYIEFCGSGLFVSGRGVPAVSGLTSSAPEIDAEQYMSFFSQSPFLNHDDHFFSDSAELFQPGSSAQLLAVACLPHA